MGAWTADVRLHVTARHREASLLKQVPRLVALRDEAVEEMLTASAKTVPGLNDGHRALPPADTLAVRQAMRRLLDEPYGKWVLMHLTGGIDLLDLAGVIGVPLRDAEEYVEHMKAFLRTLLTPTEAPRVVAARRDAEKWSKWMSGATPGPLRVSSGGKAG